MVPATVMMLVFPCPRAQRSMQPSGSASTSRQREQSLRLQSLSSLVLCLWIASSQFVADAVSLLKLDIEIDRFFEVEEPQIPNPVVNPLVFSDMIAQSAKPWTTCFVVKCHVVSQYPNVWGSSGMFSGPFPRRELQRAAGPPRCGCGGSSSAREDHQVLVVPPR